MRYEYRRVCVELHIDERVVKLTSSFYSLIAIMLGRLEMSVDQCIDAYTGMMDVVFDPKDKKKLPFKLRNGKVQPRYKTKYLERVILDIISNAGFPSDALFRGAKKSACKT